MNRLRCLAALLVGPVLVMLGGCGGETVNSASREDRMPMSGPMDGGQERRQGMSTRQKVVLLAGAAALYYMYRKHQNRQGEGAEGRYYRSKNGRIYYRKANGEAVWVTAPQQPIRVPVDEYEQYTGQRYSPQMEGRVLREAPAGW